MEGSWISVGFALEGLYQPVWEVDIEWQSQLIAKSSLRCDETQKLRLGTLRSMVHMSNSSN